jgi:cohesin complex subunit SCC1
LQFSLSFQDHLTSHPAEDEYFGLLGDSEKENLILDHVPGEEFGQPDPRTPVKRGRKRKNPLPDEEEQPATPAPAPSSAASRRSNRLAIPATPVREEQHPDPVFSPRKEVNESTEHNESMEHISSPRSVAPFTDGPLSVAPFTEDPPSVAPFTDGSPSVAPFTDGPHSVAPFTDGPLSVVPPSVAPHDTTFDNMGYDASDTNPHMANLGWEDNAASMAGAPTPGDDLGPMSMGVPSVGPPSMGAPTPYREDEDEEEEENEYNVTPTAHVPLDSSQAPGQVLPEESDEMLEGETVDEYEDRVLNKRAAHLNTILKSKLAVLPSLKLSLMTRRNTRKQAAQKFYSLLVLQKALAVNIDQPENNGEINVTKGPRFETAVI